MQPSQMVGYRYEDKRKERVLKPRPVLFVFLLLSLGPGNKLSIKFLATIDTLMDQKCIHGIYSCHEFFFAGKEFNCILDRHFFWLLDFGCSWNMNAMRSHDYSPVCYCS